MGKKRNLKERDHWEDRGVDGMIIHLLNKETGRKNIHWIHISQDRDQW
jgi:hypothetical protein